MPNSDLIIVEHGADWTAWMEARSDRPTTSISVIQSAWEAPEEFAARVKRRVAQLHQSRVRLRTITLLGGHGWDGPTLRIRLTIMRLLRESTLNPDARVELHLPFELTASTGHGQRAWEFSGAVRADARRFWHAA